MLYLYLFYRFLSFPECVFATIYLIIIICVYFVSGLVAENIILCILYFTLFVLFVRSVLDVYSCYLACRGFYKPALVQHDQSTIVCFDILL